MKGMRKKRSPLSTSPPAPLFKETPPPPSSIVKEDRNIFKSDVKNQRGFWSLSCSLFSFATPSASSSRSMRSLTLATAPSNTTSFVRWRTKSSMSPSYYSSCRVSVTSYWWSTLPSTLSFTVVWANGFAQNSKNWSTMSVEKSVKPVVTATVKIPPLKLTS